MRKYLFGLLMLICGVGYSAFAQNPELISVSSFTATDETIKYIDDTRPGDVLRGVILSTEIASIELFDSSGTQTGTIAVIGAEAALHSTYIPFNVRLSSGLTYTTKGNVDGITIIFLRTWVR